jgi:putative intracellular protease/amidase
MNTAYVLLRTGYADWEAASALAELRRTFGFAVKTIGLAAEIVVSRGGIKVMPDLPLSAFVPESADILILPGGESWTDGEVPQISEVVRAMVSLSRPLAAICAATLALAHGGLLDDRLHTSNGRKFILKSYPLPITSHKPTCRYPSGALPRSPFLDST